MIKFWKGRDSYRQLPNINDIKIIKLNTEKVENEIIKPKDDKFMVWICHKFGIGKCKELVRNFEKETHSFIDPEKQLKFEKNQKEHELEL